MQPPIAAPNSAPLKTPAPDKPPRQFLKRGLFAVVIFTILGVIAVKLVPIDPKTANEVMAAEAE